MVIQLVHICLPIVSRDVHILEIMDAMMYAVVWNYIHHDIQSECNGNTIGTHLSTDCLQGYDDELLHSFLKKSDWCMQ